MMNTNLHRFLSRREKKSAPKAVKKLDHFGGIFTYDIDPKKADKEQERRIEGILERLRHYGIDNMVDSNVEYALRAGGTNGDSEAAFKLLMLLQDTYEGIVRPYNPETKLIGAQNREGVTCYLDALLFAMFARLDSFEALLYDSFQDLPRKKLAGLLRLWVNMLRTGHLITVDITKQLQEAMAECGWQDAARLEQQDPSEAFTFITGQLELPLLTLKMDLYHTGKEDPQDDHKFVNERLLEVAIADQPGEGGGVITLEDCLEQYFNNRIEVKRHIENMRRNTLKLVESHGGLASSVEKEKEAGTHIEVAELESPGTPLFESPFPSESPTQVKDPLAKLRPGSGRARTDSIFGQRKIELVGIDPDPNTRSGGDGPTASQDRKLSLRNEVLMPAWQFFKLLPWYTDSVPDSDAQVAAHFSQKRPVLGICLKRYSYTNTEQASRANNYVDIPLEIAVPNFVGDDNMHDDGPLVGNFRLMLQSVVCHRGVSVNSGHYITLCRGHAAFRAHQIDRTDRTDSSDSEDGEDPWMRFDDLAKDRISYVDIREALKEEMPYLLFYQVQPIGDDGVSVHDLPTYAEATSRSQSDVELQEKPYLNEPPGSEYALSKSTSNLEVDSSRTEIPDMVPQSERNSLDGVAHSNEPRGRSSGSVGPKDRPGSTTFSESSFGGCAGSTKTDQSSTSVPATPPDEKTTGFLSVASKIGTRRGSRQPNSRPTSAGADISSRFSMNMHMTKFARGLGNSKSESTAAVQNVPFKASSEKAPVLISTIAVPVRDQLKESVPTAKLVDPLKMRKEKRKEKMIEKEKSKGRHSGGDGEDRDCVLM